MCAEMPAGLQVFLESNTGVQGNELEREFFILRKLIEKERDRQFADKGDPAEFYICTLSNKLIVYKVGRASASSPDTAESWLDTTPRQSVSLFPK